jgi:hypothetical protein
MATRTGADYLFGTRPQYSVSTPSDSPVPVKIVAPVSWEIPRCEGMLDHVAPNTVLFRSDAMGCDSVTEGVLRPNGTIGHEGSGTCDRSNVRPKITQN